LREKICLKRILVDPATKPPINPPAWYWLHQIAQNAATDLYRRRKKECSLETDGVHQKADPKHSSESLERAVWIGELIDSYSKDMRDAAIELLMGKTLEEVADEKSCSVSTVARLRAKLSLFKGGKEKKVKNTIEKVVAHEK
jgi:DNA-directed RNA polymerase specialized sigma24 family protein